MTRQYLVQVDERDRRQPAEPRMCWLCAIAYQSYSNSEPFRSLSQDRDEAFVFWERAAAELAAVFVGGEVIEEFAESVAE